MISYQALAVSRSDWSEPECKRLVSVRPILIAEPCSDSTGQASRSTKTLRNCPMCPESMLSAEDSPASRSQVPLEDATTPKTFGLGCSVQLEEYARVGSLLRTSLALDLTELSACAATWSPPDTRSGRSTWTLRLERGTGKGRGYSGWPTPTAKANHDSPSMRKWPAYRHYQDEAGRTTPRLWEWMMGFPYGWSGLKPLAMRWYLWRQKC